MGQRDRLIERAWYYYGAMQGDEKHRHIVNTYNSQNPLPRGVKIGTTSAWCAATVTVLGMESGVKIPRECSCGRQIDIWRSWGLWEENESVKPQVGWIAYYDWNDGRDFATTDCFEGHDHTGVVVSLEDNGFWVIEGNKGDAHKCDKRFVEYNGRYLRGFGMTQFYDEVEPVEDLKAEPAEEPRKLAKEDMPDTYTVIKGDTLFKIAAKMHGKYGATCTNWAKIARLNGLKRPYTIYLGQVLKLR